MLYEVITIIDVNEEQEMGKIRDINGYVLNSLVEKMSYNFV